MTSTRHAAPRIVFAGCAKDCAAYLPAVFRNIEAMARSASEAAFVFAENDSADGTKVLLAQWCAGRANTRVITFDGLDAVCPLRSVRRAFLREQFLAAVHDQFGTYDVFVMLDCDDCNIRPIELAAFSRAIDFLNAEPQLAAVFANQDGLYFDMWALRHPELSPGDVWEEVCDYAMALHVSDEEAFQHTLARRSFRLPPDAPPLQVQSAFGGLGLYKMTSVRRNAQHYCGCKPKPLMTMWGWKDAGWQCCEHVAFHRGFVDNGETLFVLPSLINGYTGDTRFVASVFRNYLFDLDGLARLKSQITDPAALALFARVFSSPTAELPAGHAF